MLIYTAQEQEASLLQKEIRILAARMTEEYWSFHVFREKNSADEFLESLPLLDLGCCSLDKETEISWLEAVRSRYSILKIMLIADMNISPMKYLRPQVMASSLLLKPYTRQQLEHVLEEFMESSLMCQPDPENVFVIETREGKTMIPYEQIYYVEAREKKVFIRLLKEEYGFYDTIEHLEKRLPDYFFRTHRSFIVNGKRIRKVRLAGNSVELTGGFEIPLSRSYKNVVREMKHGSTDKTKILSG